MSKKMAELFSIKRYAVKDPVRKYKIINDLTQESFTVEGPSIQGCRLIADQECERLGWSIEFLRSEEIA
ncbi:MAG: hypothetical protein AAGU15_08935 [Anaerolineaceae bacterium]